MRRGDRIVLLRDGEPAASMPWNGDETVVRSGLWMRLTVPWAVVEVVGAGRRAVNREATPANDAPWPAPRLAGTEVF